MSVEGSHRAESPHTKVEDNSPGGPSLSVSISNTSSINSNTNLNANAHASDDINDIDLDSMISAKGMSNASNIRSESRLIDKSSIPSRAHQAKQKRTSLACIRCRTRHIRCPGGNPCKKCLLAKTKCEYVEADKKIVVSMKYLSKLHDDIARLKKDNAMLRTDLKSETDKRINLSKSINGNPSNNQNHFTQSVPQIQDNTNETDIHNSTMRYPHQQQQPQRSNNQPFDRNYNGPSNEVIHPSLDKHGRLIQSRTGEKVYVGSSLMTLFGLEIQNMVPSFVSSNLFPASNSNSPMDSPSSNVNGSSPKSLTTDTSSVHPTKRETEILEKEGNAYKITLAKTNTRPGLSINFTLPSYSYAMLLVDTFINYNDGCFYFFNEGLVKKFLMNLYSGKAHENIKILKRNVPLNKGPAMDENTIKKDTDDDTILETIWFCKILLIFAIGEMYLGTESDTHMRRLKNAEALTKEFRRKNKAKGNHTKKDGSTKRNTLPGSGFFYQASELFTGLFASGAIDNITKDGGIEVMLLYAFYLQVADCTIASYFYFGLALRSTLILGWHVDADKDNLDRFELEHRRRIWWTVYMYERMLSSKAGLPLSFADDSVSTELPFDFNIGLEDFPRDECDVRGYYIFPSAEYINNCVTITQINALILSSLYTKQPSANILPVVSDLVHKLINWKSSLPEFLKVDFSVDNLQVSRLIVNLMTEYFQGMNLAVRPLLFHFATKKLKELQTQHNSNKYVDLTKYSKNVLTLLNASFQASINTIKSIWALIPENMVALFGWMDREYLFTSASTLILFNASFGVHDATREHLDHALTIFTKMKKLGNYPAALRRAQLLKLIKVLDFNGVMSSLSLKHDDEKRETNDIGEPINDDQNTFNEDFLDPTPAEIDEHIISGDGLNSIDDHIKLQSEDLNHLRHNLSHKVNNKTNPPISKTDPIGPYLDFLEFPHGSNNKSSTHSPPVLNTPSPKIGLEPLSTSQLANHPTDPTSTSRLSNESFNFNIQIPSNIGNSGDVYMNSDLAGIEGLTYIDEEQKLWNEITNDAVWLNVPGGNPNQPPSTRNAKSSLTLNSHHQPHSHDYFGQGIFGNNNNNNHSLNENVEYGQSSNLNPFQSGGGYGDIINEEFQDLMN